MGIPGRDFFIVDWPFNPITIARWRRKFKLAPALARTSPRQRFTANLVAANPVKRFFLYVRMIFIFYKKMVQCLLQNLQPC